MTAVEWVAVAVIGGSASTVRFVVDRRIASRVRTSLPVGTLTVNINGSLALGVLSGLTVGSTVSLLAGTAAVGSYTTFSTWMLETQRLSEECQHGVAVVNLAVSVVLGLGAAALGLVIGANL
ncbi:MAG: fluoride efflux transporter CrcB [Acidimicrobiales bacterium]